MGGNNSNGSCHASERVGDKINMYKVSGEDFGVPVDVVDAETYTERHARAMAGEEVWPGGEVTPDARQMIEPPERYDTIYTVGERYAHAQALGAGLLNLEALTEGEPYIAREYMEGANPYGGQVGTVAQAA
jgi:hypothetical protein